ncbi:MAG: WecB/TagA/CpsF family glycosyltransferase [Kiritimatiellae bacterium]|nr:WecB/TagA/CpsF family glycosyltransferase [Kiritimatiellia bacterium]
MRLLVSTIPYDNGKSGISVYVREVVRELAAQGHSLAILCEDSEVVKQLGSEVVRQFGSEVVEETPPNHLTTQPPNHLTTQPPNHLTIQAPRWTRRPVASMLWHLFVLPFWIRRHRREFDGFVICAANRRVCAWYPLPTTATVHDLANFHIPGKYSRLRMFYLAHVLPHYAKKAQRLVAVSEATKADMVKFWHCREKDVTVLYNGLVVKQFGSEVVKQLGSEVVEETPPNHLTTKPPNHPTTKPPNYQTLLYISRIEHPGKNHVRLIEAYSRLPRSLAEAHPLVIAGADWKDAEVVHEAAAKSPHADLIRFTGFVANEDMPRLWEEAGFYVFPSLFEGFGLSLVEAMAKGIPCACSNNGSLGEIAADVAITFDPENVDDIASALGRLLSEPEAERAARVARGLEHIKKFSWADHAKGIVRLVDDMRRASSVSRLFGIPVARVTQSEAVDRIISFAKIGKLESKPAFVATLNVDFVANAVSGWPFGGNDELWGYLRNADFVTADGMPIVLLSRLLRRRLPARVTGADMVPAICRRCAEEGLKVYVLGGDKDAVSEAFKKLHLTTQPPNHLTTILVGHDDAFVKLDEQQPEIVERINAAKPDILFVALGNPKQELWMGRNASKLDVGAMVGIGGTFNFIAGRVKRAPKWMQKSGLEWIYRIIQEPGRLWRRYAYGLVKFSWLSLLHVFGGYRR